MSLYTAAAAITANARWQELITENLAATSVPGFKRQDLAAEVVESGLSVADGAETDFVMPQMVARTNFTQGEMRVTGVNTDVAIDGVGFFEVELPDGTLGYTRDGEFHVNGQGDLVTKEGFTMMGENGPIQFDLNLGG
ncbi:MAG: flagellar hook-basal body complex protein, partial [Limisphaerales bacterium]